MRHGRARLVFGSLLLVFAVAPPVLDLWTGGRVATSLLALLLGIAALAEYRTLCGARFSQRVGRALMLFGGGGLVCAALFWSTGDEKRSYLLVALPAAFGGPAAALAWERRRVKVTAEDLTALGLVALGLALVVAPFALLLGMLHLREGVLWAVIVVLGSKLNDIGGYLGGSAFGRNRLCPGVSPKKTWEGALAGLVLGTAGCVVMVGSFGPVAELLSWWQGGVLGLALGVSSQLGDLCESFFKRSLDVKDSAALVPAFGGILDLVDSLIFAVPVGYAMGLAWL